MQRGDVVRLKGTPYITMTVEEVAMNRSKEFNDVYCVWHLEDGDIVREAFPDYVLIVVEE